ncbi:MAG TPA: energy transducer TonB [Acidobacteriaceae bacterium]
MNNGALIRSPGALHYPRTVSEHLAIEATRSQLLELRTESGTLYVFPSRWQRIRLFWIFRHFHILSPQVLSRRDRRLIEKLSRSALAKPPLPIPKDSVLGVVEQIHTRSNKAGLRAVTKRTERVGRSILQGTPDIPGLGRRGGLPDHGSLCFEEPEPGNPVTANGPGSISFHEAVAAMYGARERGREGFQQWGALGMLVAVCVLVILARVYGVSLLARTTQMWKPPTVSGLRGQAATQVLLPTMSLPGVEKAKQRVTPLKPETTFIARKATPAPAGSKASIIDSSPAGPFQSAPVASSDASERLFVSELPQGQFVEPVVSDPSLVGELHLRALIDADGSVKEVTVVSGDPKLAEAGLRAVRRWHYSPYQSPGGSGEGETLIRMLFFGQDTVSITSIARSRSESK